MTPKWRIKQATNLLNRALKLAEEAPVHLFYGEPGFFEVDKAIVSLSQAIDALKDAADALPDSKHVFMDDAGNVASFRGK